MEKSVQDTAQMVMQIMLALQPIIIMMAVPFGVHILRAMSKVMAAIDAAKAPESPGGSEVTASEKADALAAGLETLQKK